MTFTAESARAAQLKGAATRAANHAARKLATSTPAATIPTQNGAPIKPSTVTAAPPPASPLQPKSGELDWWKMPIPAAEVELTRLRDQWERASHILESRRNQAPRKMWKCAICQTPMADGQWKFKDDSRRDPQTGMVDPAVVCSIDCFTRYNVKRQFAGRSRR